MSQNNEEYHEDELTPPEWLDETFLLDVLKQYEKDDTNIKIRDYKITPGTVKGDHYGSIMFRAMVEYTHKAEEKRNSFIIKVMPETESNKTNMLKKSKIFETEVDIYRHPKAMFEEILNKAGDNNKFGARLVYYSLSPHQILVLEDLVVQDYTVVRGREATMDEVKGALKKLAKWHAIGYKVLTEHPEELDPYSYDLTTVPNLTDNPFIADSLKLFNEMLDSEPNLKQYKPYFAAMQKNMIKNLVACFREYRVNRREDSIYALCHGDFHRKNMMFKHDKDGICEDMYFVDYQISYVGPVMNDFIHAIFMLMTAEMREHNLEELLQYYYSNFTETLEAIGFEGRVPPLDDFKAQLKRQRDYELFLVVAFLPMWYDFQYGEGNAELLFNTVDYRQKMYKLPKFVKEMEAVIPKYVQLGYFDNL